MATYLVTGGAGFIGSNLVRALIDGGHRVRVLDDLSTGHRENLDGLDVELHVGSVVERADVATAMVDVAYVLHQAAVVSVEYSLDHPRETHAVNEGGTALVIEEAGRAGVRRVVVASSCAIYGDPQHLPLHEGLTTDPKSAYAASKLAAEELVRGSSGRGGPEAVALRYFNIYGPRQDPASQYAAVIPLFVRAHLGRSGVTLFGDGHQTRDFCYVGDVVRANLLACEAPGIDGMAFNVGTGSETSLWDLLGAIEGHVGEGVEVRHGPPREGDLRRSVADVALARDRIGFTARTSLHGGLGRTVEWFARD